MGVEIGRLTVRCTINSTPPAREKGGDADEDRARRKREILAEVQRVVRDRMVDPRER